MHRYELSDAQWQRLEAGPERGAQTLLVVNVVGDAHFQIAQCLFDALRLETCHHDDGTSDAPKRCAYAMSDDRLAFDRFEQLVARFHAGGATGGKHDGGDLQKSCHYRL